MIRHILLTCMLLLGAATNASAQGVVPQPGSADPRIRTIVYNPYEVVWLRGNLGYQMMIEFHPSERIENVSIGDSTAWQVTPNRKATLLFLKPVTASAATNMTVITNLRRYSFQLTASDRSGTEDPNVIFGVRFVYAEEPRVVEVAPPAPPPPPAEPPVENLNFAYEITGSKKISPVSVFDDGISTFFQFADQIETPAIFALDAAGVENLVNFRVRGRHFVVDAVAQSFALRLGREKALVRNRVFGQAALVAPKQEAAGTPVPTPPAMVVETLPPVQPPTQPAIQLTAEPPGLAVPDLATVREITQQALTETPPEIRPQAPPQTPAAAQPAEIAAPEPGLRDARGEAAVGEAQQSIQVGAYSSQEKADEVAGKLTDLRPYVSSVAVGGRTLHRVRLGPWPRSEADSVLVRVQELGFDDARLVTDPTGGERPYETTGFTIRKGNSDYTGQSAASNVGTALGQAAENRP